MKKSEKDKQKIEQIDRLWRIMKDEVVENTQYPADSIYRYTISANTFNTANPMANKLDKDISILIEMNWIQLLTDQMVLDTDMNLEISPNRIYGILPDGRRAVMHLNKTDFTAKIRRHLDKKEQDEWNEKWGDFGKLALAAIVGGLFVLIISHLFTPGTTK